MRSVKTGLVPIKPLHKLIQMAQIQVHITSSVAETVIVGLILRLLEYMTDATPILMD